MIIWQMTREEFLTPGPNMSSDVAVSLGMFLDTLESPGWHEGTEVEIESHPGFATGAVKQPGVPAHVNGGEISCHWGGVKPGQMNFPRSSRLA
jgi:hypothetical protein